jgi:exosortase/archaeosortase family protein
MTLSDWAIALVVVLVVIGGIIAAFGTVGYLIAGRSIKRPFLRYIVRYAIAFLLLLSLEAIILWLAPSVHRTLQHLTAVAVGWVLELADVHNSVSGSAIGVQEPYIVFKIDVACLGGLLFWAYMALVLAEPRATGRQRLIGLGMGLAGLLVFNLFRIFISIYIEWRTGVNVHNYFYLFNMVFVLLLWAGWVWTLKPRPERSQDYSQGAGAG